MIPKTGLYLLSSLLTLTMCYAGVQVYKTYYSEDAPAKKNISTQNAFTQNTFTQSAFVQCGGQFIDAGGVDNPYEADSDETYTFCPDVAGDVVTVTFTFVDIETTTGGGSQDGCWDFLSVYSGSDTSTPLQQTACGELDGDGGTPSVAESLLQAGDFFISNSADGCLTFTFSSDGSVQGQGWVADITCGPPPQCAQPTGLSFTNITQDAADLIWASIETSFDVEWGPAGFTPGTGTTVSGVGNPYTLSGLDASTAYDYYVCALCDDGAGGTIASDCSGPQTFTTTDAPPACGGFFIDSGGLDGNYEASANETVTICPDVAGDVVTVTFTFVDLEVGGSNGGCFDFLSIYSGSDTSMPLQQFACGELDGDGGTPSVATSLLQAGDFFTSQSSDGCLTFTFTSDGSVQEGGWAADITCAPPADCPPPASLTVSNIGGSSAELSWTSAETTFNIEYDTTGFTPGMGTMVNGVSNPYTLTGLMPETSYEYYVCAVCDDGAGGTIVSNCTGPLSFTTDVACPAPTDLAVANETETSADLSWTSVESNFDIEWGEAGFTPGMGTTISGVSNPFTLTGLSAATAYEYYVCAVCDDGMGGQIKSECTGPLAFGTTVPPPMCGGPFVDNGGPAGTYAANSSDSLTICPDVAGDVVTVTFTFVDIETGGTDNDDCYDFLSIYNGSDDSTPLQQFACGELDGDGGTPSEATSLLQAGDFFTSTAADGCLTITFNSDGFVQEQGWEANITCAPPADCPQPAGLMASNIGGSSAELSWASDETTFNIEYDTTGFTPGMGMMVSGVSNPYTLTGLMPETSYEYYVCAVCDDGAGGTIVSTCTGPQTFTTDVACPAPTDLAVANETETSADLSWTSVESNFDIEWGEAGFTPGMGTTVSGATNPFTLTGLSAATAYEYYVCAVCDDGMGGQIKSECTGPLAFGTAVPAPTCSSSVFVDNGGPAASYAANSSDSLTICPDVAGDVVTVTFTFVDMETSTATGVQDGCWDFLSVYNGSGTADTLQMTACGELDGDGGTPSVPESLLQAGDFFTSTAADGCLTFTFSSDGSAQEEGWEATITCAPPSACPQPTDLAAPNVSSTSAQLTWMSDESTFDIEWGPTGFTPGSGTVVNGVSNPYILTGLTPETTYDYYVCAVCDDGMGGTITSNCSGPSSFTTDVACPAPTDLAVANETETSADLSWTSAETAFDIEWGEAGFAPGMGTTVNGVTNPYTLTGLSAATAYEYYVCAVCDDGMGGTINSTCTGPFSFATAVPAPTCSSGIFLDNGGAAAYSSSSSDSIVICPDMMGDVVTVTFTFVDIETGGSNGGCWDYLSIYNGSGTLDTLQAFACGELDGDGSTPSEPTSLLQAGDSFTSTAADGCLTFTFSSDGSFQEEGWEATVTCAPPAGVPGCTDPCATNYDPAATMDDGSCTLPEAPTTACYETATFNDATCVWDVTGEQPAEPTTACYETATFNDATCVWDVTGEQPVAPTTACYETATFNDATCVWDVTGEQPNIDDGCEFTDDSFDDVNCVAVNTSNCPTGTTLNTVDCSCDTDVILGCTDPCATNYDPAANSDDGSCTLPAEPTTACYETATFNTTTCMWDVTGEQPAEPATACYETATFNGTTCMWDVSGEQPAEPTTACYETATFNDATCVWDVTGEMPTIDDGCDVTDDSFDDVNCIAVNTPNCPTGTTYDSVNCDCTTDAVPGCTDPCATNYNPDANTDDGSCTLPAEPSTECYETATFNTTTCMWDVTGSQPAEPATACYETATFNSATCMWDVSGEQPAEPTTACYETATFNDATCVWDVTGDMPTIDDGCDVTDDSFDDVNCVAVNTPNCPAGTMFNATNCECVTDPIPGCTDATACNYDANADTDDGSCVFATGCDTCAADGTVLDNPETGDTCNDGDSTTENDTIQSDCTCAGTPIGIPGCTDANACNYDAAATIDDGSCILPGDVCNDGNPLTINDTVQADCSCAGIDSGEAIPTVGEWGLIILALILLNLGVLYIRQTEMKIEKA